MTYDLHARQCAWGQNRIMKNLSGIFSCLRNALVVMAFAVLAPPVGAAWPEQPITFVVSYPAGGGADLMARLVAEQMAPLLGQSVVVENRGGAGGMIGAAYVANAKPDGYTVLVDAASFSINPSLFPKLTYDGVRAFEPVGVLARFPSVIVVPPKSAIKTVADLVRQAKADPDGSFYASTGNGSAQNFAAVLFMQQAGIRMNQVPFKGGAQAMTAVMGGQVPVFFANAASSIANIKGGLLRAVAVASPTRLAALPDVPTIAESGVQGAESYEWNGMFVPRGTPQDIVDRLAAALDRALEAPSVAQRVQDLGGQRLPGGRAAALEFVKEQSDLAKHIVRANNIMPD